MAFVADSSRFARVRSVVLLVVAFLAASDAAAQGECLQSTAPDKMGAPVECFGGSLPGVFVCGQVTENCSWGTTYPTGVCPTRVCGGFQVCRRPTLPQEPTFEIVDNLDGTYSARMGFEVDAPWLREARDGDGVQDFSHELSCRWWAAATVCATGVESNVCDYTASDVARCFIERDGLTCGGAPYDFGTFSFRAERCGNQAGCGGPLGGTCAQWEDRSNLSFEVTAEMLGCPVPRKEECQECLANVGGAGGKVPIGGGAACALPIDSGPGAMLRYAGGGVGQSGLPGTAEWAPTLGRNWSHDYAERIVVDPDESHVWLLTRWATFREFSDPVGGVYTTVSPSDEYRTLEHTASGWTLTDLEGTVTEFDSAGLWLSTTDRNGNAKTGTYTGGQLTSVDFPDGRREDFVYNGGGRLTTLTEVGTDGLTTRTWSYTWSGDDLERIERPDGRAWVMTYDDPAHPGYLTLLELEGTDDTSRRVEQGWEYDARGNAIRTWRGAATFAAAGAVDKWELTFDDPLSPAVTTVTDPLGQQIVYALGRDTTSDKPRVESISGGCPGCGLESDTTFVYGADHPLLPIQQTDAEGNVTAFTYTAFGQVETRTEAFAVPGLERTTTFTYDATYPVLVAEIERPSTAGTPHLRRTTFTRNAAGDPTGRTIEGIEAGSPFSLTTTTAFNAAGQPLTVDPPAYGTADATSFTYDGSLGGLVLTSRTDPLAGTTTFGHDAFNRRTSTIDPNGLQTTTAYDDLGRLIELRQKGADPADDLVTAHAYTIFGDLAQTTLPDGKLVRYGYDVAGRLTSVERRSADGTQRERMLYALDGAGNRTSEQHERWDGAGWVAESWTDFEHWSRCHLGRVLHADGTVTRYDYTCSGLLDRVWDANHPFVDEASTPPTERYLYDALDRLIEVRQPWAGAGGGEAITTYAYDVQDHLSAVTDAEGNTTTYSYSDRDLLTDEVSPVSGTTSHAYNEHGELVSTTDARAITAARTVDEADRVVRVDYPGAELDVTYTYGTNPAAFDLGRLTGIERDGATVAYAYAYDRFGRVTQDGDLTYGYDKNGNRTSIGYPGGVAAGYTFDFADRESTLAVTSPAGTQPVVTASSYLPSGPLASLSLGNGNVETRSHTTRYFPHAIALDAARDRSYTFTTDAVGNVTSITEAVECLSDVTLDNRTVTGTEVHQSCATVTAGPAFTVAAGGSLTLRAATKVVLESGFSVASGASFSAGTDPDLDGSTWTFGYQDTAYFLTAATGPWGDLAWTYDRIGNRLSETRDGWTDAYVYTANGAGGNTPLLESIALAVGGTRDFTHGPAGHLTQVSSSGNVVDFTSDAAGRLAQADRLGNTTAFAYDGRSYLDQAGSEADATGATRPVYSSGGVLHTLTQRITPGDPGETHHVFHFDGRPVAQLSIDDGAETWRYLTTDHLGTPWVATDAAGAELWHGPFEPFGRDRWAGTNLAASEEDVFLRFPGQWNDEMWLEATRGAEVYYNLHRWYQTATGRYTRPDPMASHIAARVHHLRLTPDQLYSYANGRPIDRLDPYGLEVQICQRPNEIPQFEGVPVLDDLPHRWIKTPDKEVGLGEAGGGIPGDEAPECGCRATEIVDHTGESQRSEATCRVVPLVDEACVNRLLEIGRPRGNWLPIVNDCWTFVDAVITECRENPGRPRYRQSPL